ncbi:hypothetical protein WB401_12905 [Streptomyces brasiliscabiei]|uniref:HEPN domain-containing protein n=1 Tax=Streptomyces brasiliscabiei TaxID=2736302 RepID=A0ABU8GL44_9ACTN
MDLLRKIRDTVRVAEPAPPRPEGGQPPAAKENGAYTSAVIMLGSLLEGVLVHAADVRHATLPLARPARDTRLQELIQHAHTNQWIDQDAKMASDLLRTYRNLVHPLAEKRAKHSADFDTADLCWSTVNAVLNDLAASNSQ